MKAWLAIEGLIGFDPPSEAARTDTPKIIYREDNRYLKAFNRGNNRKGQDLDVMTMNDIRSIALEDPSDAEERYRIKIKIALYGIHKIGDRRWQYLIYGFHWPIREIHPFKLGRLGSDFHIHIILLLQL